MPTLNRRCVEASLLTALALQCKINAVSFFERKHYFYADLPAGYQITQQKQPIAVHGDFQYPIINPRTHKLTYKTAKITRIQLEHDSARTLKSESLSYQFNKDEAMFENSLLIDLNRAGMGLMEIVTDPVFEDAFEAYSFVRELALVLRLIGTCNGVIGEGSFRVDVNVSVHELEKSSDPPKVLPGTRVELKNLASFNDILKATEYEIKRQKKLVKSKEKVVMETRTYDSNQKKTVSIRLKEDKYDYRFMPEPNLLPLVVYPAKTFTAESANSLGCSNNPELNFDSDYLDKLEAIKSTPSAYVDLDKVKAEFATKTTPQTRRNKLIEKFGMKDETAFVFVANDLDKILVEVISKRVNDSDYVKTCVSVLNRFYLNQINTNPSIDKFEFELKCKKIGSFVELIMNKVIGTRVHLKVFGMLFQIENEAKLADELVKEHDLYLVSDPSLILESLEKLFEENPKAVGEYKTKANKRAKIFDFFVGRLHKNFNDRADSKVIDSLVDESLKKLIK